MPKASPSLTQRVVLGSDHPDTLRSMCNLAVLHANQRRYDQSETLYIEAIVIQRRVLGEDDPETLRSINNLAILYTDQGRYEDAEPLHRTALDGRGRVLRPDHPDTQCPLGSHQASEFDHSHPWRWRFRGW